MLAKTTKSKQGLAMILKSVPDCPKSQEPVTNMKI
jgi:hypothetical protein